MKLGSLLNESQILTGFTAKDKWESIDKMIDLLINQGRLNDKQRTAVSNALVARVVRCSVAKRPRYRR